MPAPFVLSTLGYPSLQARGGEPIRFRTRKHFAVLIRLALAGGHRCAREELMEMLWPSVAAKLARHSLAQAVTVIKSKVGREQVMAIRNAVALSPGAIDVDVLAMDGDGFEIGGPFLEGFEIPGARGFDQWKDEWTAKLLPKIRDCLVRQMDAGRRLGDFTSVEKRAGMLLQLDGLSEDGVRGVMEARAWVGDRSSALKAYDVFVAQLADVLGAKPSPDIVRMADLLREGNAQSGRTRVVSEPSGRRERRMEAETIVGRSREFSQLYDTWLDVRRKRARVVVLTGDPGIGKTTLTNAFLSTCQLEGAVIARVQAYDAERELPFAVLSELVRQLVLQRTISGAEPEALAELSRICPEVGAAFPGVPKPPDWSAEVIPLRLADALLKSVIAAAEESPVVMVVDDVHAADNSSAAILHMVARKIAHARFMLILAGRPTELRLSGAAGSLVADPGIGGLANVDLEPLTDDAARDLVMRLLSDSPLGDPPVDRIVVAGRGNGLALELLAREWADHGPDSLLRDLEAINTTPAPRIGIPPAVRSIFEREARRLDPGLRATLDFAAVLGRRLHEVDLYQAVGMNPMAASSSLNRLMEEGLLREVQGVLEFRNELIRAQAYYSTSSLARDRLHKAAGEALSKMSLQERAGADLEIAWHLLRGRDLEGAIEFALVGAARSLERGAASEAEQVLSAIQRSPAYRQPLARLSLLLAQALIDQSRADEAAPLLETLTKAEGIDLVDQARIAAMQASAEYMLARETGVRHSAAAEAALQAAERASEPRIVADSLYALARAHAETGSAPGLSRVRETIDRLKLVPEYARQPVLHYAEGYCEFLQGDAAYAGQCVAQALDLISEPSGARRLPLLNGLGVCRLHAGDISGACESYSKAYALACKVGDDAWSCIVASNLCSAWTQIGSLERALAFGRLGVQYAVSGLRQPRGAVSFLNLANAHLLGENRIEALECLDQASRMVDEQTNWEPKVILHIDSACISLCLGDLDGAFRHIALLESMVGQHIGPPSWGVCERLSVLRTFHVSGPQDAWERSRAAMKRFEKMNLMFYLDVAVGRAFVERNHIGRYEPETQKALNLIESLGLRGKQRLLRSQGFLA